jgi:hypothetical protein
VLVDDEEIYPCRIACRSGDGRDQPKLDWVVADPEDDRDGRGRGFRRAR